MRLFRTFVSLVVDMWCVNLIHRRFIRFTFCPLSLCCLDRLDFTFLLFCRSRWYIFEFDIYFCYSLYPAVSCLIFSITCHIEHLLSIHENKWNNNESKSKINSHFAAWSSDGFQKYNLFSMLIMKPSEAKCWIKSHAHARDWLWRWSSFIVHVHFTRAKSLVLLSLRECQLNVNMLYVSSLLFGFKNDDEEINVRLTRWLRNDYS